MDDVFLIYRLLVTFLVRSVPRCAEKYGFAISGKPRIICKRLCDFCVQLLHVIADKTTSKDFKLY
jgi:hypothetical protein